MDTPTHYELLCVTPEATADEIRNAYRRLIRLYHPDVSGAAGEAMTLRLNEARGDLLDPARRAQYDRSHGYAGAGGHSRTSRPEPRMHDDWRPGSRQQSPTAPATNASFRYRAWMVIAVGSVAAVIALTVIVFAWSYSGPLAFTTPRVVPPLVIAVGWIVGGFSRPSRLFVALLILGSALWPLAAFGVAPFALLSDAVPPEILVALTLFGCAVLALRISAPLVNRLDRFRSATA